MNYFERIDNYKRQLFFQVNGKYLDVYVPKVPKWNQDLLVATDILKCASSYGLADSYGVLTLRTFSGTLNEAEKSTLDSLLAKANAEIAVELGESDITKGMNIPKRHFSAIIWGDSFLPKKKKEHKVEVEETVEETKTYVQAEKNEPKRRQRNTDSSVNPD